MSPVARAAGSAAVRGSWAPLAVFALHCVASLGFDAYDRFPWIDVPMHLLGGLAVGYFVDRCLFLLLPSRETTPELRRAEPVLILSLVCTGAVLWEFAEFVVDRWVGTDSQVGLEDTLGDLLVGLVGGGIYLAMRGRRGLRGQAAP
jgi:hypothetical protein